MARPFTNAPPRQPPLGAYILSLSLLFSLPLSHAINLRTQATAAPSPNSTSDSYASYSSTTAFVLLSLKSFLQGSFGATWTVGSPCNTWEGTVCTMSGDLIELNLRGLGLLGTIPESFYAITTLQKLDLSRNRIYGGINRRLAAINQDLYYLDLSNNLFSGPYPDIWIGANLNMDSNFMLMQGSNYVYIDISNTFFNGYSTVWVQNDAFFVNGAYPYFCIGSNTQGSFHRSCTFNLGESTVGNVLAQCPFDQSMQPRDSTECLQFCGIGADNITKIWSTCSSQPGQLCKPDFLSTTGKPTCTALSPTPVVPQLPAFTSGGAVQDSDVSALNQLFVSLGNTSSLAVFGQSSIQCSQLGALAKCNSDGYIAALTLQNLGLQADVSLLSPIKLLTALVQLILASNSFYGNWTGTFDLRYDLLQLIYVDLSNNKFVGNLPSFNSFPTLINLANNYFSGPATVSYQAAPAYIDPTLANPPTVGIPAVYCPVGSYGSLDLSGNCLTTKINPPCLIQQAQKSLAQCQAMCGIQPSTSSEGQPPQGPCQDGALGSCVLLGGTFQCNSRGATSQSTSAPINGQQLLYLVQRYIGWGTKESVFETWVDKQPCSTPGVDTGYWKGLTCDSNGRVIAINLSGKGLIGPFLQPSVFQDPYWNGLSYAGTVRSLDLSNNKLYGVLDPTQLQFMTQMDRLDVSNNYLTGPLMQFTAGQYQYLNFSFNYFTGVPYTHAIDNATVMCPGSTPIFDVRFNCFDIATSACPAMRKRLPATCKSFCNGASSKKKVCKARNTVCKAAPKKKPSKKGKKGKKKKTTLIGICAKP